MIKFIKNNWVKLLSIPVILAITIITVMFSFPAAAESVSFAQLVKDIVSLNPEAAVVVDVAGVISDIYLFFFEDAVLQNREDSRVKILAAWKCFTDNSTFTEDDFADYWNKCIEELGIADDRLIMIEDTVRLGLTLSDVIQYCYHSDGDGVAVSEQGDIKVSAEKFQDIVARLSELYGPKNTSNRHSWQTDKAYNTHLSFFSEGTFFNSGLSEIYCVPFFYSGKTKDTYYYSLCQLHFYQQVSQDEDGNNVVSLYMDYYNWFDGGETTTYLVSEDLSTIRYMRFPDITCSELTFRGFTAYSDFLTYSNGSYMSVAGVNIGTSYDLSDLTLNTSINWQSTLPWAIRYTTNSAAEIAAQDYADYGFFYSNAPINMGAYDIDWDKMPDDYSVVASGDTIYDYDIIDNTTGDTTTINNYINNNYTYPDNDNDNNSGGFGGGQTSGNVTVGGNITVDGKVDVDVNVNISSDNKSKSEFDLDFSAPTVDSLEDGRDELNELIGFYDDSSKSISSLFQGFYGILPPAIANMIPVAVAAIVFVGLVRVLH